MKENRTELLAPAGNIEKAKVAIDFGADAIYLGAKKYSLRARASNFGREELIEVIKYAHGRSAKVYTATNIICHNADITDAKEYMTMLKEVGIDALIVADPYLIDMALKMGLEVHISTQQSITNSKAAKFWANKGSTRIVTGREVDGSELKEMIKATPEIEYEYFIHGAVCIAYSGRCTMSNHLSYRDSNRGGCAQSCRWMFDTEGGLERFTMSAKDSSLHNEMKELIEMGVKSFKIEGRMKSLHYVGTIVSAYRKAMDDIFDTNDYDREETARSLEKAKNRDVDTNFYHGIPEGKSQFYGELDKASPRQDFIFTVEEGTNSVGLLKVKVRNKFSVGQNIEIFGSSFKTITSTITMMYDKDMNKIDVANKPMSIIYIKIDKPVNGYAMGRKLNG